MKVLLNQEKVHKTDVIAMSNQPIWTVESGSLFLLDIESCNDTTKNILTFEVRDRDPLLPGTIGKTQCIGTVRLDVKKIMDHYSTEERVEFPIVSNVYQAAREGILSWDDDDDDDDDDVGEGKCTSKAEETDLLGSQVVTKKISKDAPPLSGDEAILSLRFRRATPEDVHLIENLKAGRLDLVGSENLGGESKQKASALMTEGEVNVGGSVGGLVDSFKFTLSASKGKGHKLKLRVKPGPDPMRPEQTRFLSEEELIAATYSPSKQWIECGSGTHGRVYIEVLHCDGVPNYDAGGGLGGKKTNTFVSIVHEDAAVQTNVIPSLLSPLWLPWTKRAFAFNRMHPLSSMYIGVFHYDPVNPLGHQGIGRVCINLGQLRPDHDYILKYNLHQSSVYSNRKQNGSITVRLRIDQPDPKVLLLKITKPLPQFQINVKKKKTRDIVKYTCYGRHLEGKFDVNLLKSQVNEMVELVQDIQYAVVDAAKSLIFWKGQVMLGGKAKFPLYSLLAYIFCANAVEKPHLLPSLPFWLLFFVMVASFGHQSHHPSPWHRPRPITDYLSIIVKGKGTSRVNCIQAGQGMKEVDVLEQAHKSRIELDAMAATKRAEMQQKVTVVEEAADNKKGTGSTVPQIDPLAMLLPVQKKIEQAIVLPRALRSIITWEISSVSFFITSVSLAAAILLSVLPSLWIIHWICRVAVHALLGPHMKVVDIIFYDDGIDKFKQEQDMLKNLTAEFRGKNKAARIKAETEVKQTAMRKVRLGRLSVNIPPVNVTRYYDYPLLMDSTAEPAATKLMKGWKNRHIYPGQNLYGRMIPAQKLMKDEEEEETDDERTEAEDYDKEKIQKLVQHKLLVAQAKADLDTSFISRREVVEQLQHLVSEEEMSSYLPNEDAAEDGDSVRVSISNEGSAPDESVSKDKVGCARRNECEDEESSSAIDNDSSLLLQGETDDECAKAVNLISNQGGTVREDTITIDADFHGGSDLSSLSQHMTTELKECANEDLGGDVSHQDQRDEDDQESSERDDGDDEFDDPFATYSEEKRALSATEGQTTSPSDPPTDTANKVLPQRRRWFGGRDKKVSD